MGNKGKSILLLLSKSLTIFLNVISMMILSRYLTLGEYSEYRQIITVITLITSIFSLGLPSAILYYMSGEDRNKNLPNFYMVILLLSILLVPISYLILYYFDYNFNTSLFTNYSLLFILLFILSFLGSSLENLFISFNKFKLVVANAVCPNLIFLLCMLYVILNKPTTVGILFTLIIRELIRLLIFIYFILRTHMRFEDINIRKVKEIILFSIPIGVSAIIGTLNVNVDKLITGKLLDKNSFAIIANASYEIPVLGLIGLSLFNILVPSFKSKYNEKKQEDLLLLWKRTGKLMITIVVPITIGFIVFAREIIIILFSEKYIDAVNLFKIYQLNALSRIYYYGSLFLAVGLNKLYTRNAIINLISNTILNIVFINLLGISGAALANVISAQLLIFIQSRQVAKILNAKIGDVFPIWDFMKGIIISYIISKLIYSIYFEIFTLNIYVGLIFMLASIGAGILVLNKVISREILDYLIKVYSVFKEKFHAIYKRGLKKDS